jgi:aminoglycoside 3-N-acetyltransferase
MRALLDALAHTVPHDGVLVVHSGFRRLSNAGHRAETFIETLLDHLSAGTLVMPAMSWRNVTLENPIFDELATPSHVGVVAELFRTRYATARSLHPTHSVSAAGRLAVILTATHHIGTTPCASNSPYGLMREHPAFILMLDCGFERCTAIHLAEELVAPDRYLLPLDQAETYALRDRHGDLHSMRLRRHRRLNRCFEKFEPRMAARGRMHHDQINGVPFLLYGMDDLLGEVMAELERTHDGTLAPDGVPTRLSRSKSGLEAQAMPRPPQ